MELHVVSYGIDSVARPLLLFFSSENQLLWFRFGSRYRVRRIQGLDTTYWGFLGVGTTLDIFQNIIFIPYFQYGVLVFSGYGVLSFIPLWSLGLEVGSIRSVQGIGYGVLEFLGARIRRKHGYAVSSLMDTAYWSSE
ncbi:hypothetical protein Tco_0920312 [Tanacetum coccineum]